MKRANRSRRPSLQGRITNRRRNVLRSSSDVRSADKAAVRPQRITPVDARNTPRSRNAEDRDNGNSPVVSVRIGARVLETLDAHVEKLRDDSTTWPKPNRSSYIEEALRARLRSDGAL